jgi:UDP-N-acetylmuramoylalanine--D-glutamate ligase
MRLNMTHKNTNLKIVAGLGITGLSCVRYLTQQGAKVAVMDSREHPPGIDVFQKEFNDVPLVTGKFTDAWIEEADEIILSPGISLKDPIIAQYLNRGVSICGDIELFAKANTAPIIAITGSNGKTTLTTLMGQILAAAKKNVSVCGNIGTPVLDTLTTPAADCCVMELSSFQLETTYSLKAQAAVVLNISPDHMDRYDSYQDYLAAKQRIYFGCTTAIINLDEPEIWQDISLPKKTIGFTLKEPQTGQFGMRYKTDQWFLCLGDELLFSADRLKLKGKHHWQNALAALALAEATHIPRAAVFSVLESFAGLPHRCQWVGKKRGMDWYNDSKGTNVGATIAALQTLGPDFSGRIFLIAGGDAKGADLSSLRDPVSKYVKQAILLGKDADLLEKALKDSTHILRVKDMENAVQYAYKEGSAGDVVLLSPACSSLDMFNNYEHRGQVFQELVQHLPV